MKTKPIGYMTSDSTRQFFERYVTCNREATGTLPKLSKVRGHWFPTHAIIAGTSNGSTEAYNSREGRQNQLVFCLVGDDYSRIVVEEVKLQLELPATEET